MRHDYGHATAEERARIDLLDRKLADGSMETDERLELALLHLEPMHQGKAAAQLLTDSLHRDGDDLVARIWLAYCGIYDLLDTEALKKAIEICDGITMSEGPSYLKAAAWMLKATGLRDLDLERSPVAELEKSIALAPGWVSNRQLLAQVLLEQGNSRRGAEELSVALRNRLAGVPAMDTVGRYFDELVTGLAAENVERMQDQLRRLDPSTPP